MNETGRPLAIVSAEALQALPPGRRLMGLDVGTKTIGLALSDVGRRIASPLETIRRGKFKPDAERLLALAAKHGVGALVLGLPLNMDASEGPRAQSVRAFARNLAALTPLPLAFWDERLSTAAVTRTLIAADASRARRAELVDKMAAAYILQGLLDRLSHIARHRDGDPSDAPDAQ
jgi:putative holliday junction resolvase